MISLCGRFDGLIYYCIVILIDRYDTKLRIMRQESTESRKDFTGFYKGYL